MKTEQQNQAIHLNYLFGSYPAKGFHQSEVKTTKGLLGGKFTLTEGDTVWELLEIGKLGLWHCVPLISWEGDYETSNYMTIDIPVTLSQVAALRKIFKDHNRRNIKHTAGDTHDLSLFFSHRRIQAIYDVLADITVLNPCPACLIFLRFNYARQLRRYLTRKALVNGWPVRFHSGRETRVWETI